MTIVSYLPTVNATLNGLAGVFLFLGWIAIRSHKQELHKKLMLTAFCLSMLFLGSYITYHWLKKGVVTHYAGTGLAKIIYLTILSTHTVLAVIIVPLSITAIVHAWKKNFAAHVKVTQWLWPMWMYVSVTGVVVYLVLYIF